VVNDQILLRECNERETFSRLAVEGRSAVVPDEELLMSDELIEQYAVVLRGVERPATTPLEQMVAWLGPNLENKRVLEICCHNCEFGTILARLGATVDSIDIAAPLIAQAHRRAAINGVADRLRPAVMSVHDMQFPGGTFDVVFGKAALHHLDLPAARDEIFRVLKPGAIGVFSEPVAFSRALQTLRRLVPVKLDAESPDERPLSDADLEEFCRPFTGRQVVYARILARLNRVLPSFSLALRRCDRALLSSWPALRTVAGICTFAVVRPAAVMPAVV
jgi:2-polyprenyl-3-methyl-5-hydroxy-6-metoxy-1,4-benzoquinol methylase